DAVGGHLPGRERRVRVGVAGVSPEEGVAGGRAPGPALLEEAAEGNGRRAPVVELVEDVLELHDGGLIPAPGSVEVGVGLGGAAEAGRGHDDVVRAAVAPVYDVVHPDPRRASDGGGLGGPE